ncbi:ATP-binding protein [Pontibacter cellulosilyticus]|uniref:Oxygen sensor histidine kinase NreB n=1 Tax=Pontibacter cellulosilyticus TaxID=1720253 RepID=A0A923SJ22_9BACT|nr:ATP-binding protein [Pontibacter cellulosilyticus]MBC5992261.1 response regulator [Pontibacter cellulosilyticus]
MKESTFAPQPTSDTGFLGSSQMHQQIRDFAWEESLLGPISSWPQSLRTAVHIMLGSDYPMAIWWGRDMIMLNNDAYMHFMGNRQQASLGKPAKLMWADIWEVVGPMFNKVLDTGEAWFADKLLLYNERKGFKEEAYFTFSCSPIIQEDGSVGGIFCTSSEETRQVLSERRLETLRQIGAVSVKSGSIADVSSELCSILGASKRDTPFALLYNCVNNSLALSNYTQVSFAKELKLIPALASGAAWPLQQYAKMVAPVLLEDLSALLPHLVLPDHQMLPQRALALPIVGSGREQLSGWLIIGISPLLEYDEQYVNFLNLLHTHVNALCSNVRVVEQEKERNRKLLELNDAKTAFFSNISHEFRTPITLMLGPVESLLEQEAFRSEQEKQQLEMIRRNGLRLLKQVNYLLNFSSIESGKAKAGFCAVDLASFTKELGSTFTSVMERAGLKYSINCDAVTEPFYVDPEMWEKIIYNLLSNAFKFTLEGEVTLRLIDHSEEVELQVQDTGVGIAPDELPQIFNRFHKIQNNCGRSYEGSGIGLSMVAELVKMHHGSITVDSAPGKGSSFSVVLKKGKEHLPFESIISSDARTYQVSGKEGANPYLIEAGSWLATNDDTTGYSDQTNNTEAGQLKSTVLLTDDNQDMLAYIKRVLEPSYRVLTSSNGQEALAHLRSEAVDVVLSDSMMPVMDGIALLQEIRKQPKLSALPVILLSAQAGEEEKLRGLGLGADDYMTKPFSARELLVRIKSQLQIAELRKNALQREHRLLLESQELKAELTDILANMSDAFIVLDKDLRYTYINDNAGKFTNRTEVDFIGNVIWDVFPELEGTIFYDKVLEAKQTGQEVQFDMEYPTLNAWFDVKVYPYKQGLSMYICNTTVRKMEEQARQELEMRFKVMADAAPVLIWISEFGNEPIYFNKSWLKFRGRSLEQEQQNGWLQGVHPDDQALLLDNYKAALRTHKPYEMELRLLGADGAYHWFLNHGVPRFMPDGSFAGYIGASVDITKRKWAEDLLSKYNRDLEEKVAERTQALQFANTMLQEEIASKKKAQASLSRSHEQLRALTSHLQVMREEERKYIARELHDELGQAFTALKIDVVLLLKKLATGNVEQKLLQEELENMQKTINGSIKSVRDIVAALRPAVLDNFGLLSEVESQAQDFQKRTTIAVEVNAELDYIALDREISIEIFRIIQETLTNVARHAGATAVTIDVTKSEAHFCFTISDNGKGMAPDSLTDMRTFGLLGMHERAARIGANLLFDSSPETGTKVRLDVPLGQMQHISI